MDIKKESLPKGRLALTIELSVDEVRPYVDKALRELTQEYHKKGFRKGRVPQDVVRQELGEMAIYQTAAEDMIQATLYGVLDQEHIVVVGQPQVDIVKLAPKNPFSYKAVVSILPEVCVGAIKNIAFTKKPVTVADKEVDAMLKDLQKMRAQTAVKVGVAQKGDRVILDMEMFLDKVPLDGGQGKNVSVVLGEELYIPGLSEQLEGLAKDEEKSFTIIFPERYKDKHIAGKAVDFKVRVNAVQEITQPELTNDFAVTVGSKDIDDLKKKLTENLRAEKDMREEERAELALLDALVGASEFGDIPETLVHNEVHKMLHELEESIAQQGAKFSDYLLQIKKTAEELEKDMLPQAENRVKTSLVLRQIFADQQLQVTDDEVAKELDRIKAQHAHDQESLEKIESVAYRRYMHNLLGNRKVIAWLKEQTKKNVGLREY
ncbi:MAG: trigger factor [Parcubacteria group bacterium CG08_land_8_20_14_0_20_48_21]|nr:MAG: trigger factor [Parcubacteria group bacterium CG2_30_48_51]PIS33149.1 MAG: trigger factor [Parcubacteria group bacterium CG08_land_8_20_14_0_20_48_21]